MPDVPTLGLVLWRPVTDPPITVEGRFWTDRGPLLWNSLGMDGPGWYEHSFIAEDYVLADRQPSVWCDPSPPDMNDPLTAEDMRDIADTAQAWIDDGRPYVTGLPQRIARLRRALDAIERNPG